MSKQVTLSKFFAAKNPKSSGNSFATDEETLSKRNGKNGKSSSSSSKRKQSPKESNNPKPPKKTCLSPPSNGINSCQEPIPSTTAASQKTPLGKLTENTLKRLSEFSADCEPSTSYTDIKQKSYQNNKTRSDSPPPSTSSCENPVCLDSSDDEAMEIQGVSKQSNLSGRFASGKNTWKPKVAPIVNKTTKTKYTPLEQQFMEIKEQYPDSVLFVECGYKYRFFGDDAEIAAKVLKIFAHPDHNFMTASIPTHRLFVHVRRLVSAGYKVGVVKQTETAALKAAGSNKAGPFGRKLSALYTKSTLIGEDVDPLSGVGDTDAASPGVHPNNYLMCVYDSPTGLRKGSKHEVGMLAVDPGTGDVVYDCFEDGDTRAELEKRITHIQPVEMLLPDSLTNRTEKLISDVVALSSTEDDRIRLERLGDDNFLYSQAFETVSGFYSGTSLQSVVNLPKPVICCLSAIIVYLKDFHLQNALQLTSNFTEFSLKSKFLQLGGSTVRNLELFQNLTDGRQRATLFWVINHTVTKFGCRLLRSWLANPLMDVSAIRERQEAVEELGCGSLSGLVKLRDVLAKLPDLEKGLCSIYYKKCSTGEFYLVCKALEKMFREMKTLSSSVGDQVKSTLIKTILTEVPGLLGEAKSFSGLINEKAARENDKPNLFSDESKFPQIVGRKKEMADVQLDLKDHLRDVRRTVRQPALNYVTVLQTEFLVEVRNTQLKLVPSNWTKISSTKAVSRFHTPVIVEKYKLLNQLREQLVLDATDAWRDFLQEFSEFYLQFKRGIQHLATLDCLLSLSTLAQQNGYCRPEVVDDTVCVEIDQGRHPVIDVLKADHEQFVPNDTQLQASGERVMIITGPNMGGKSSYIRQVALISIMAQIGSFVPADRVTLGVLDAIYTRMGAADEIFKGRSTFMVELEEASDIMAHATERSLVIMDELGRGTSTHDGVAIAFATLNFFIKEVKNLTLFVTHYPMLSEFEGTYPDIVGNYHMSFLLHEDDDEDDGDVITFLYQLVRGVAAKSYGLNVARLADIATNIIKLATQKSSEFEQKVLCKRKTMQVLLSCFGSESDILQAVKTSCDTDV
ncbi:DNA mismatch repair protein Msh3-like [Haliotis cracherodii]|uniref:DNA mismatch repair protein Msh3-like n=1 Tax=Haliotis cracherodii TaxID=6455 RepID=UPI0039ECC0BC